ncbi:YrdB family protein [Nocardia sp. NPDC052112]|uniref:YrdB family protein n=1 Tax=Nocardia sp. NPDC052112 TaxID=3155646 RepID=UPI00343AF994
MTVLKGANPALMFPLELGVLAGAAIWGCTRDANPAVRVIAGIGAPAVFIVVWALFAAGGGKNARYPLTGPWRGLLEFAWFGGADRTPHRRSRVLRGVGDQRRAAAAVAPGLRPTIGSRIRTPGQPEDRLGARCSRVRLSLL